MATTAVDRVMVDTNVLVYASLRNSPRHGRAIQAIHNLLQANAELWISRQILREYVAVLTLVNDVKLMASNGQVAANDVQAFERMFRVADDTLLVTKHLLTLVRSRAVGGKQIHDANIVATMQAIGVARLLTNNPGDFVRFADLVTITPLSPITKQ